MQSESFPSENHVERARLEDSLRYSLSLAIQPNGLRRTALSGLVAM